MLYRKRGLELFRDHPQVRRLLDLKTAYDHFRKETDRMEAGGKPLVDSLGPEVTSAIAEDCELIIASLALCMRIDGEPLVLQNF